MAENMMHFVRSAAEVLLLLAAFHGWGCLVHTWAYRAKPTGWAYPSALGIAFLIAVGGLLNSVHLARTPVLLALLAAGLGLTLFFVTRIVITRKQNNQPLLPLPKRLDWNTVGNLAYLALLLLVFSFLVITLLPTSTFNFHDDFHIYLMWPIRMLETGTLGGNPFDHTGLSSLGGQSFMQGLLLSVAPLADINGFDAILCQLLALGLIKELGDRLKVHSVFILLACFLALVINPQYVNVTSLYSATLMLLGLTWATLLLTEPTAPSDKSAVFRGAVPCSLFFAALLALKTTFVFTAPLFWIASLAGSLWLRTEKRPVLLAHIASAGGTIVFLLPWLAVHLDRYILKIHYILNNIHYSLSTSLLTKGDVLSRLFSNKNLLYGNTYLDYLMVAAMLCLTLTAAGWFSRQHKEKRNTSFLVPFLALLISVLFTYPLYYKLTFFSAWLYVRYTSPLLLGAGAIAVLLAGLFWQEGYGRRQKQSKGASVLMAIGSLLLLCQLTIIGLFGETFLERIQVAVSEKTLLSFPLAHDQQYVNYNTYALSEEAQREISTIQSVVPADESILAWIAMPMHLDFRRNKIFATAEYGLSNSLLVMPVEEGTEAMRRFFQKLGIRYIMWQYQGYGMKPPTQYGDLQRKIIEVLSDLVPASRILFNDGEIIVFDIDQGN